MSAATDPVSRWVLVTFVAGPCDGEKKRYRLVPPADKPSPRIVRQWGGRAYDYRLARAWPHDDGYRTRYVLHGSRPAVSDR